MAMFTDMDEGGGPVWSQGEGFSVCQLTHRQLLQR